MTRHLGRYPEPENIVRSDVLSPLAKIADVAETVPVVVERECCEGFATCPVCDDSVDLEHDTDFVTTRLGVVVHTWHLPSPHTQGEIA